MRLINGLPKVRTRKSDEGVWTDDADEVGGGTRAPVISAENLES